MYSFIYLFFVYIYIPDMTSEVEPNDINCYFYYCGLFALLRNQSVLSHVVRIYVTAMQYSLINCIYTYQLMNLS